MSSLKQVMDRLKQMGLRGSFGDAFPFRRPFLKRPFVIFVTPTSIAIAGTISYAYWKSLEGSATEKEMFTNVWLRRLFSAARSQFVADTSQTFVDTMIRSNQLFAKELPVTYTKSIYAIRL